MECQINKDHYVSLEVARKLKGENKRLRKVEINLRESAGILKGKLSDSLEDVERFEQENNRLRVAIECSLVKLCFIIASALIDGDVTERCKETEKILKEALGEGG